MEMKYVVFDEEYIVIFTKCLTHSGVLYNSTFGEFDSKEATSAGFIHVGVDTAGRIIAECHGESISLRLKSRPKEDSQLAIQMLAGRYS